MIDNCHIRLKWAVLLGHNIHKVWIGLCLGTLHDALQKSNIESVFNIIDEINKNINCVITITSHSNNDVIKSHNCKISVGGFSSSFKFGGNPFLSWKWLD